MANGTRQDQRLAEALGAGHMLPDEFALAERVRITLAQAGGLRFGARDDGGRWDMALRQDPAMLLAELATFPLARRDGEFLGALECEAEAALWQRIWQLVRAYDGWCWGLVGLDTPGDGPSAIDVEGDGIGDALGEALLAQIGQGLGAMLSTGIAAFGHGGGALHPAWSSGAASPAAPLAQPLPEPAGAARRQWLRRCWLALRLAIARVQPLAHAQFARSLASGAHEPSMGLLLSALQLFQYSREPLNRFPARLVDFYYRDVLRLAPRPAVPEFVHLLLARAPRHAGDVEIAAGTRFVGGKDHQGRALEFAAETAVAVTGTHVSALCSLRMERDPTISPERDFDYPTRVRVDTVPLLPPDAAYAERAPWWPLLGGAMRASAAQAHAARLGFALASPLLQLQEGRREIRVRLLFAHPATDDHALQRALRTPAAARDAAWLSEVYRRYAAHEQQHFPGRPRATPAPAVADPEVLARDAWARASSFDGDVQLSFLLALCLACTTPDRFAERLGRLFAAWLVAADEDLRAEDLAALRAHAARLDPARAARRVEIDDPLILIHPPRDASTAAARPDRTLIFDRVFHGVFQAQLSAATGWLAVENVYACRRPGSDGVADGAVELVLRLGADAPAIVPCQPAAHGAGWPAQAVLQCTLRTQSRLYAYGLLVQYAVRAVRLSVSAHDVRNVVLYNQLGRLDPSKPFLPWGPTPVPGSYLVFGSAELAGKPLQSLHLDLRWSGLPGGAGGFPAHYDGYPGDWPAAGFASGAEVLADGQWRSDDGPALPLFSTAGGERLASRHRLTLPSTALRSFHRAAPPRADAPFVYGLEARSGFFRLPLAAPPAAFGHALYPSLLANALTRNARLKRPGPLPNEPYTPVLEGLSIGYTASDEIALHGAGTEDNPHATLQMLHVHPFGTAPLTRAGAPSPRLLPSIAGDGNLYIGLDGDERADLAGDGGDPQGALSLFFHLRRDVAAGRWADDAPQLSWSTWHADGWRPLPAHAVIADGTQGMLRSGIVQLNLPAGMVRERAAQPSEAYWLRLSADWGFVRLAGLYGVHCHAVRATRVLAAEMPGQGQGGDGAPGTALPPGSVNRAARALPGLGMVCQVGPSEGWRPADPPEAVRLRGAERLRHKGRAVTRWDYERLLLDAFPQVWKVRCFPHHEVTLDDALTAGGARRHHLANRPGQVLVVVVPYPQPGDLFSSTEAPRLDAAMLDAMQRYLQSCAAPGASVRVRNAAYERAQVRCIVQLARGHHPGTALRALNQAIVEHLSPWHPDGLGAEFGWSVRADALEAFLRAQDGVAAVGRVSMLHIVRNDRQFNALRDTAAQVLNGEARTLRPAQPWSLLLPTRRHLIELRDEVGPLVPRRTGIRRLEVGSTFIVGRPAPTSSGQERHDQ